MSSESEAKPNILVFVVDQMHARSMGCGGNPDVETPNLDALANTGSHFTRGYCNNPVCMPSRATLFTGLTPRQHGLLTNGCSLPENIPTLPEVLRKEGYRTHACGKLHLQPFAGPVSPGADPLAVDSFENSARWRNGLIEALPKPYYGLESVDYVGGHVSYHFGNYANWLAKEHPQWADAYKPENGLERSSVVQEAFKMKIPAELHYNRWIADRSIDFIEKHTEAAEDPFFLWTSFPDPHHPFAAAAPYCDRYDPKALKLPETWKTSDEASVPGGLRSPKKEDLDEATLRLILAQTYGMISHIDAEIGRVIKSLKERGLFDNTVIVFIADHGEYLGSHGLIRKSYLPYEEVLRVPFLVKGVGETSASKHVDAPVSLLDLVPTLLDFANVPEDAMNIRTVGASEYPGLPGKSLKAIVQASDADIANQSLENHDVWVEYDEDWHDGKMVRMFVLVEKHLKLVQYGHTDERFLFDIEADPLELQNLIGLDQYREQVARMTAKMARIQVSASRLDTPRISGA